MSEIKKHAEVLSNLYDVISDVITCQKVEECEKALDYFISLASRIKAVNGTLPEVEKAHTYGSENADVYRAYDAGQESMRARCLLALASKLDRERLAFVLWKTRVANDTDTQTSLKKSWEIYSDTFKKEYRELADAIIESVVRG